MENKKELNMDDLEKVVGGGSEQYLPPKKGCFVYRIRKGDTPNKLADKFHISSLKILYFNPSITSCDEDLTLDYFIYLPDCCRKYL